MSNLNLKSADNEVVQLNSDSTAISHITDHIFDVAETAIGSMYLLDDGCMTDFKYVNIDGVPLTKEDFNMAIEAIVYLYDPYDAYYAHEGEKYANISYENLLKEYNMTKINLNKVTQLNTKNINSNFSSSMEEAFAKHGYTSSDVVAEAETDIGSMFLFKDGLLTDLQSIYISEVPLTLEDMGKAIRACLYLYGVYGSQMCTYEHIINELNNIE